MPPLHELQRRFAAALFDDAATAICADLRTDGSDNSIRLGIYRTQLHATFLRTLACQYPVIARLVGSDYFKRLAFEFQGAAPSRAGALQRLGAAFATFLRTRFCGGPYDYLAHVAALEWAYQESMSAAARPGLNCSALRDIDPGDYAQLHFELHPTCRLVSSEYPIVAIWRANQPDAAASERIDLASGATRVLLHRAAHSVQFHDLDAAEFALLEALAQRLTLGAALDAAQNADPAFDLGPALRHFVVLRVLTDATLGELRAVLSVHARPP